MTREEERARAAATALSRHYRLLARELLVVAQALDAAPLADLAKVPVRHMHSLAREKEEALDEALMAL